MNKVIASGRLTKDSEVRYSNTANGQTAVARFTLAVDRKNKKEGQQTADFISCVSFGKTAEFLEKFGKKGTKFIVEGHIQTGSYTDKDGKKVYTTDVCVDAVEFAESKGSNTEPTPAPSNNFMDIPDDTLDELPFV